MADKAISMGDGVSSDPGSPQSPPNGNGWILKVENLQKQFPVSAGVFRKPAHFVHAVDGFNFEIPEGGSLGLVGESGCGKTTTGKLIVKLYEPTEGHIYLRDPGRRKLYRRGCSPGPRAEGLSPPGADDLPGPLRIAEPPPDDF